MTVEAADARAELEAMGAKLTETDKVVLSAGRKVGRELHLRVNFPSNFVEAVATVDFDLLDDQPEQLDKERKRVWALLLEEVRRRPSLAA